MDNLGAEVGQKMRSAIKAKLLELNCYVDDELPDYVMVMVANKRTKSQMKEDLQLFLANKTPIFVDWLHIVLKKLKEVTVTNPEVYKKVTKRKADETPNIPLKKEKKDKKVKKEDKKSTNEDSDVTSLTDNLPINASQLSEQRKIIIMKENKGSNASEQVINDDFDIPPLSAVGFSTEEELEDIKQKIKSVKSRLGILVASDDEDCSKLKLEQDKQETVIPKKTQSSPVKRKQHTKITFKKDNDVPSKRKSVLERLGHSQFKEKNQEKSSKRSRIDLSELQQSNEKKNHQRPKESVLNRLGVMSKVSIPEKKQVVEPEPFKTREVPSMVKVKPRIIPADAPQASKNLLLKAVAEAQRSVAQTPSVGHNLKPDALYTKKYKEKEHGSGEKSSHFDKKLKKPENEDNLHYVPKSINHSQESILKYIPTTKNIDENETEKPNQKFKVTFDGLQQTKPPEEAKKPSIKDRLDKRKSPSPIVFEMKKASDENEDVLDKLPTLPSVKHKERCKYWPSCRQGEKCEFFHPTLSCEKFPHCKFGDKCLFIHPICKFGSSCTRRDCVYSHNSLIKNIAQRPVQANPVSMQICKFFPNCVNINCTFLHPKPCKFGKFCKNQKDCTFTHNVKGNLTWRSK